METIKSRMDMIDKNIISNWEIIACNYPSVDNATIEKLNHNLMIAHRLWVQALRLEERYQNGTL